MLAYLLRPLINTIKAEIMNSIEAKFQKLTETIAAEKAQVAAIIAPLKADIAELKAKLAGGLDSTTIEAKLDALIDEAMGIVDPAAPPNPEASAPDAAEVAPAA
jgi:hypothetical protein